MRLRRAIPAALAAVVVANPAAAKVTADEAARLDADLTPLGAVAAGNESGLSPSVGGRHHSASTELRARRASDRPVLRGQAAVRHRR